MILPGNQPCVMVVEDEVLVRMLLADRLREENFRVIEAANASEATELLEQGLELAAVITDVRMPGRMNGLELAQLVHSRWPHVKVIVTSGYLNTADNLVPSSITFIRKPYEPALIVSRLREP